MKATEALELAKGLPERILQQSIDACIADIKDASMVGSTQATINVQTQLLDACVEKLKQLGYKVKKESSTTMSVDWTNV